MEQTSLDTFLGRLAEALAADPQELTLDTPLASFAGWDSMGQVATIALLDELGATVPPGMLHKAKTPRDLAALANLC